LHNDLIFTFVIVILSAFIGYLFPIKKQLYQKKEITYDFTILITNEIFLSMCLASFTILVVDNLHLPELTLSLHGLHLGIQFIVFLIVIDFFSYWVHRFAHTIPSIWKIHKLHHGVTYMNPLAAFRHSFLWQIYNYTFMGVVGSLLSIDLDIRIMVIFLTLAVDIFQHSNVSIKIPYYLNYLFILPRNHNFHHSKENFLVKGQNFGLVFSCWDIIFKSFYLPKSGEVEFGFNGEQLPKNPFKKYLYPLSFKKE
jgi:sterol desaturase/sphingolipid hydroxylase (fatty acid hydroxylase superfamily)